MASAGERLRALREAKGLSMGELSRRTGVDRGYLSRVENDIFPPSNAFLRKVGKELGLSEVLDALDVLARFQS